MFRTPRKSSYKAGGRTPGSSSRDASKGLFENGQWYCDCEPRLPAVHLQTKKKGKNNGRWFYTCQLERKKQCGFFLWEDAAQAREKEYLFSGGREKDESMIRTHIGSSPPPLPEGLRSSYAAPGLLQTQQSTPGFGEGSRGFSLSTVSTGDEMDFMSAADRESQRRSAERRIKMEEEEEEEDGAMSGARPSGKRKRDIFVGDSDEDEFSAGLGADEERVMLALAESATQSQMSKRRETQQFATPSAQRTHDVLHGMPTPNTGTVGRNSLLIATEQRERDDKRQRLDIPSTPSHPRSGSNSSTVQPPCMPQSSASGAEDYPITEEVMAVLAGVPMLNDNVTSAVRRTLNDYALRMKGVERGRDMVRTVVKAKDAKIAELQARVAHLEQQRTADRERIRTLASLVKDMS